VGVCYSPTVKLPQEESVGLYSDEEKEKELQVERQKEGVDKNKEHSCKAAIHTTVCVVSARVTLSLFYISISLNISPY
jgi:hypothetical protein